MSTPKLAATLSPLRCGLGTAIIEEKCRRDSHDRFDFWRVSHRKTLLAQNLLQKYQYPTLSMDLLKMGLIRSGQTDLTPEDDRALEEYLWPIVREMVKTAIENNQDDSWFTVDMCLEENQRNLELCRKFDCPYILIDEEYHVDIEL